ncbi:MAG: hypothetical protein IJ111_03070 [Eggerthellaceae bacterium]|nr:hypothetical protein [Eggerthellaceae bacterium]
MMKRYLTDSSNVFAESDVRVKRTVGIPEMRLVKVYPHITFQRFIGMGAALTEASGYVFAQMNEPTRQEFIDRCFSVAGNRYSLARLSIQSCDFSLGARPYMGKRDDDLRGFSIDDDWGYVIPLVKAAQQVNPSLQFLASPWSPPAWAKTNRMMKFGGHLRRDSYDLWARMVARTLSEYRALGIDIGRITVQNEPQAVQTWESCLYSAKQEREFLHGSLKPALREAGLGHVKTLIWDHNKEGALDRAAEVMHDEVFADDVDGVAFHWYSGDHFEALRVVRDFIGPDKELIFTEGCDSYSAGDPEQELPHAEHYAHEIIGDLEAGANAIIDWNILLDAQGGPNHVGNFCDAPIMYDCENGQLSIRLPFHYLGHFSRFIQPGAVRMLTSRYTPDIETCAFANPDGTHVLVALNRNWWDVSFDLTWNDAALGSRIASIDAPAHSIQTICW